MVFPLETLQVFSDRNCMKDVMKILDIDNLLKIGNKIKKKTQQFDKKKL